MKSTLPKEIVEDEVLQEQIRNHVMGIVKGISRDEIVAQIALETKRKLDNIPQETFLREFGRIIKSDANLMSKLNNSVDDYIRSVYDKHDARVNDLIEGIVERNTVEMVDKIISRKTFKLSLS